MFEIFFTDNATSQLEKLKTNKSLYKRYEAVKKTIFFLSSNPRHKSLKTHEFTSLKGPSGEKVFEAYAEQSTPAAYRVFWCYGSQKKSDYHYCNNASPLMIILTITSLKIYFICFFTWYYPKYIRVDQ